MGILYPWNIQYKGSILSGYVTGIIQSQDEIADSVTTGGCFRSRISFPREYPHLPPKMRFETPIYHPNSTSLFPFPPFHYPGPPLACTPIQYTSGRTNSTQSTRRAKYAFRSSTIQKKIAQDTRAQQNGGHPLRRRVRSCLA